MLNRRRFSDRAVIATFLMLLLLLIAVLTFWLVYPKITSALESVMKKKRLANVFNGKNGPRRPREFFT